MSEKINLDLERKKTLSVEAQIEKNLSLKKVQNQVIENLRSMQVSYKSKYEEGSLKF